MTASKELLEKLHSVVGEQLLARIESGQATASEFAQAIKFLQTNGIEAVPVADSALAKLETNLFARLPFSDIENVTIQ